MPLRVQDRAVWVGSEVFRPVGSSGKVRGILSDKQFVEIDWGGGSETVCKIGTQVITCRQAANKGIAPWADIAEETKQRDARMREVGIGERYEPPYLQAVHKITFGNIKRSRFTGEETKS